jgi:hypothetical protein
MLSEIFLSLFAVTFLVAVIAFSAYGYLLFTLLKHRSDSFQTNSVGEFLIFLWKLLFYYIHRAFTGFFGVERGQDYPFLESYHGEIKNAESDTERLLTAYRIFSSAYILFFILLICLILVVIYMIAGPVI